MRKTNEQETKIQFDLTSWELVKLRNILFSCRGDLVGPSECSTLIFNFLDSITFALTSQLETSIYRQFAETQLPQLITYGPCFATKFIAHQRLIIAICLQLIILLNYGIYNSHVF